MYISTSSTPQLRNGKRHSPFIENGSGICLCKLNHFSFEFRRLNSQVPNPEMNAARHTGQWAQGTRIFFQNAALQRVKLFVKLFTIFVNYKQFCTAFMYGLEFILILHKQYSSFNNNTQRTMNRHHNEKCSISAYKHYPTSIQESLIKSFSQRPNMSIRDESKMKSQQC